jgi:hypothetical protein
MKGGLSPKKYIKMRAILGATSKGLPYSNYYVMQEKESSTP